MLKTSTIESSAVIYRDSWEVEEFIITSHPTRPPRAGFTWMMQVSLASIPRSFRSSSPISLPLILLPPVTPVSLCLSLSKTLLFTLSAFYY